MAPEDESVNSQAPLMLAANACQTAGAAVPGTQQDAAIATQ